MDKFSSMPSGWCLFAIDIPRCGHTCSGRWPVTPHEPVYDLALELKT
jgi:hypothetical protein